MDEELAGQIKQGQKVAWDAGEFVEIAKLISSVGERITRHAGVAADEEVLDVACGTCARRCRRREQARGDRAEAATDVWGVGAVLWAAATRLRPFPRTEGPPEQLERRAESVAAHRRLPRRLAQAIDGCLEPEPAARPTLAELSEELEATL